MVRSPGPRRPSAKRWGKTLEDALDPAAFSGLDKISAFLFLHWPFSHLHELYEIFGREKLEQFMEVFAGMTLRVPSKEVLSDALRDHTIYEGLSGGTVSVAELAKRYNLPASTVYDIQERVRGFYESIGSDRAPHLEKERTEP